MRELPWVLLAVAACSEPTAPPPEHRFAAVTHADGRFVAVGHHVLASAGAGLVATSVDGVAWTTTDLPGDHELYGVAHGDGRWVAVGGAVGDFGFAGPTVVVSDDGVAWRGAPAVPVGAAYLSTVAHGNGVFLTGDGSSGRLYRSPQGESWAALDLTANLWWSPGVDFVGDRFIAYGDGGAVAESADGTTWGFADLGVTQVSRVIAHGERALGLATYDCCFGEVPEAIQGIVLEGPETWTAQVRPGERLHDVAFVDGAVIGAGERGLLRGPDIGAAVDWTLAPVTGDVGTRALAAAGSTVVAVGDGILVSRDAGLTWAPIELPSAR